ncbi:hypothetical protein UPYG_G00228770 [Umbra pygmaea]|uniref:Zinc transporter ZIP8 n=1 Tax=Umbra pygmaea TaxID=75934 RepID=A0ABD0WD00_UMBPY
MEIPDQCFRCVVMLALLCVPGSNSEQVDKNGQGFLQNILQFYGENNSISTAHLENFLFLMSMRRPEFILDEKNPLANSECLSVGQILSHYGLTNASQLNLEHLERVCPALLTQVLLPSCPYQPPTTLMTYHGEYYRNHTSLMTYHGEYYINHTSLTSVSYHVWGYGFLSVTIINLASLLGLALIPLTKKAYFPKVLTYFIGLAIGTLFSNAVLQLIPEALGFDPRSDDYILKAIGIFGGFYLLFFTENVLKMALKTRPEQGRLSPPDFERQNSLQNGNVSFIITNLQTISTDKTSPDPASSMEHVPPSTFQISQQEVHVNNVMCHWLRGQSIANIKTVAWMVTLSDALHNFIDGLAIGASFTVSVVAGFSTSIAIVCEEFPHELGDFVILLNSGMSVPQAVFFNLLSAMSCYVGLAFGILLGSNFAPNAIFAIAGGMFLYIALADMFPEMNTIMNEQEGSTLTKVIFFLIQNAGLLSGFAIILLITMFAGEINLG